MFHKRNSAEKTRNKAIWIQYELVWWWWSGMPIQILLRLIFLFLFECVQLQKPSLANGPDLKENVKIRNEADNLRQIWCFLWHLPTHCHWHAILVVVIAVAIAVVVEVVNYCNTFAELSMTRCHWHVREALKKWPESQLVEKTWCGKNPSEPKWRSKLGSAYHHNDYLSQINRALWQSHF